MHFSFKTIMVLVLGFPHHKPANSQVMYMPTSKFDRPCVSLLPGVNRMRHGVDLTMLDLFPMENDIQDGFRKPVVDFWCNQKKMETFDSIIYDIPDQIWNFAPLPAGLLDAQVRVYEDKVDIMRQFGRDVNLDVTRSNTGSFTGSGTYNFFMKIVADNKHVVEDVYGGIQVSQATMLPTWSLKPSIHMHNYVTNYLPKTISNEKEAAKYEEFIRIFGTHYFSEAKFGGLMRMSIFSDSTLYDSFSREKIESAAKAVFTFHMLPNRTVNFGVNDANGNNEDVFTVLNKASGKRIRYYGGHPAIGTTGNTLLDVTLWEGTIHHIPWLLGGHLIPIYELLEDPGKRENLKAMTQVYMDKAELRMLHYLLNEKIRTDGSHIGATAILNRINFLMNQYRPNHQEVVEISQSVDIPAWFLRNTRLCHRWEPPDTAAHNCPEGTPHTRCARPGEMTPIYIDRSSNGYGCNVSWSLHSHEYDSWFDDVEICFSWQGNDPEECGGEKEGIRCAKVNTFTDAYYDKTYDQGCALRWMLVIPDNAPWWTESLLFCVSWTPFDSHSNNYYCGGYGEASFGKEFCSKPNSWTNFYFDKTSESEGYHRFCKLSWGLKYV